MFIICSLSGWIQSTSRWYKAFPRCNKMFVRKKHTVRTQLNAGKYGYFNRVDVTYWMARPEISGPVVLMCAVILPAGEITSTIPSEALSVIRLRQEIVFQKSIVNFGCSITLQGLWYLWHHIAPHISCQQHQWSDRKDPRYHWAGRTRWRGRPPWAAGRTEVRGWPSSRPRSYSNGDRRKQINKVTKLLKHGLLTWIFRRVRRQCQKGRPEIRARWASKSGHWGCCW